MQGPICKMCEMYENINDGTIPGVLMGNDLGTWEHGAQLQTQGSNCLTERELYVCAVSGQKLMNLGFIEYTEYAY